MVAYNTIRHNREGTEHVAGRLVEPASSMATTWSTLLEDARLRKPDIDVLDEDAWPAI